jgi:hypothetical protein
MSFRGRGRGREARGRGRTAEPKYHDPHISVGPSIDLLNRPFTIPKKENCSRLIITFVHFFYLRHKMRVIYPALAKVYLCRVLLKKNKVERVSVKVSII